MPSAKQVLDIRVLNCGGMVDLMSEKEADFLVSALGIVRNVAGQGRATPRAKVTLSRAYKRSDALDAFSDEDDVLHLIAHATVATLQIGNGKSNLDATVLKSKGDAGKAKMPAIVVSTACEFLSPAWKAALSSCDVKILIAAKQEVSPANLVAFDMAFYTALLANVRKGHSTVDRVKISFGLANKFYRDVHAAGAKYAKFELVEL